MSSSTIVQRVSPEAKHLTAIADMPRALVAPEPGENSDVAEPVRLQPYLVDGSPITLVVSASLRVSCATLILRLDASTVSPVPASDVLASVMFGAEPPPAYMDMCLFDHQRLSVRLQPPRYATTTPQQLRDYLKAKELAL